MLREQRSLDGTVLAASEVAVPVTILSVGATLMAAGSLTARPLARSGNWPARLAGRAVALAKAHPDLVILAALVIVALVMRGMLLTRAPLFLRRDSVAYFQVGWEFANGFGFDLPLRRTPLYPLFIAGVVWLLGEDLRGLALAQHLLGVVTVTATYFLGRTMFGRLAGALAALGVAVSAPLLIYEHYILAEPLFMPLLTLGLLLTVLALQRNGRWLYLAGGLVLALAALTRPIGQALLPIVPLVILFHHWDAARGWRPAALLQALRPAVLPVVLALLGFALVMVPWMVRSSMTTGRVSGAGAMGQSLIGRIIRHDEGFILPKPDSPSPHADPRKTEIRALILTQMNRDARPSAINHRIRNVFDLTEPEADAALREVALEIFTSQPGRYVEGTLAKFRRLLVGEDERLRVHWGTRKDGELRDSWTSEESIAHLYSPPSPIQEREQPVVEAATRVFQPYQWSWVLGPLLLLGIGWGLWRGTGGSAADVPGRTRAPTLLLILTVLALVFPSAALVGYVPRYRYPVDPLLLVLAAGGLLTAVTLARAGWSRLRSRA